jgi:pseudouridine synthase
LLTERLQKFLARRGICSRRAAESLIRAGRVRVNGAVANVLGTRIDPVADRVSVDNEPVPRELPRRVLMLHKPVGVLSTCRPGREEGTIVTDLVPVDRRYFPVGRLDRESSGLLLITDDGDLTYRLTHPRFGCEKVYTVTADCAINSERFAALCKGVVLEDGPARPKSVERIAPNTLRITLIEGRNREVRRMFEALGLSVKRLHRERFGGLSIGGLKPGQWRELSDAEVAMLQSSSATRTPSSNR